MISRDCTLTIRSVVGCVVGEAGNLVTTRVSAASTTNAPGTDYVYPEVTTDG